MAKKDFSGINTGRVYSEIEQATSDKKNRSKASVQEQKERASAMKTQGRKGCKAKRINMAFSPENYDYLMSLSVYTGKTLTETCNMILRTFEKEHPEITEKIEPITADREKVLSIFE